MSDPDLADESYTGSGDRRRAPEVGCRRRDEPVQLLARQLGAIDAWNAARALRERTIRASAGSRDQRLDAARRTDALRRTQQALLDQVARQQTGELGLLLAPGPSAIIAHSNRWYAGQISQELQAAGITVLTLTDNGADALGVVIAEQPDLLFAGDRLAMITTPALLAEAALFASRTVLVGQSGHEEEPGLLDAGARTVLPRVLPAGEVGRRLRELTDGGNVGAQP